MGRGRRSESSLHYKKLPSDSLLLFHSRKHSEIDDDDDDDDELAKPALSLIVCLLWFMEGFFTHQATPPSLHSNGSMAGGEPRHLDEA